VHAAGLIVKEEGILGLWSGAAPTVMRNGTNQMCLFWAKNNFDRIFFNKEEGDGRTLQPWQSMLSGFSAACLGPVATGPFDVIKVWRACIPMSMYIADRLWLWHWSL
jgi:solute carrier family 25 citrate transporter 1